MQNNPNSTKSTLRQKSLITWVVGGISEHVSVELRPAYNAVTMALTVS